MDTIQVSLDLLGCHIADLCKTFSALIELRQRLQLLAEDPDTEVPYRIPNLVCCMLSRRNRENLVQFL